MSNNAVEQSLFSECIRFPLTFSVTRLSTVHYQGYYFYTAV